MAENNKSENGKSKGYPLDECICLGYNEESEELRVKSASLHQ